jgi:hypothetical protein
MSTYRVVAADDDEGITIKNSPRRREQECESISFMQIILKASMSA